MQLLSVMVQRGNADMYQVWSARVISHEQGLLISQEQGLRYAGIAVPVLMS